PRTEYWFDISLLETTPGSTLSDRKTSRKGPGMSRTWSGSIRWTPASADCAPSTVISSNSRLSDESTTSNRTGAELRTVTESMRDANPTKLKRSAYRPSGKRSWYDPSSADAVPKLVPSTTTV